MGRNKTNSLTRYQAPRGLQQNRFKYGKNTVTGAINLYDAVSTGFDIYKSHTKTGTQTKKTTKLKPKALANGWYVDTISGINHKFPRSLQAVIDTSGQSSFSKQIPVKQDAILSRVNQVTLLNLHPLSELRVAGVIPNNTRLHLSTQQWKIMFTNMSNVKICYEYYYVTPKGDQPFTFQANIDTLQVALAGGAALNAVFTNWKPSDVPELLKTYNILGKSVFRLGPGETGELHCKDRLYNTFSNSDIQADVAGQTKPQYKGGSNTQLFCRWYGCPTGIAQTAALSLVTDAVFGDHLLATSWIAESKYYYYRSDPDTPDYAGWDSTVKNAVTGTETVVTEGQTDINNAQAR